MSIQKLTMSHWIPDKSEAMHDDTLGTLLRAVAAEVPDKIALVDGKGAKAERKRWSYSELLADAEIAASFLLTHFKPGERIGIYAPNSGDWIVLQHAMAMAGIILVPINPAYAETELKTIVDNAGLSGLFHVDEYRGRDLGKLAGKMQQGSDDLRLVFSLDNWRDHLKNIVKLKEFPQVSCDDTIMIQYTSGTTGFPKGACLHHKGVVNMARFIGERAGFPKYGNWVNAMPLYHIGGSVVTAMGTLNARGTYILAPAFDPAEMLELIESEQGNATLIVPTMILGLLEHPDFEKHDVSSMTTILTGAANVPETLALRAKEAFGCELSILFGQTEINGVASQTGMDDTLADQCGTLGQPLPHTEICIADPESGEIMPCGEQGEIWVRGYQVMSGYYGMEDATKETITPEGWLRMGDLGTMDERGFLRIVGRLKDMIIRGGINIYPREIEDCLFQHDGVAQASVIAIPDDRWGETVAAVIIAADPNRPPDTAELHQYCRDNLASHKTPSSWYFVTEYPLTPSGKIQKFELVKSVESGAITPA